MNKVLGILFLMSLVACSKSGPEAPSPEDSSDFISLEAKDMSISGDLLIGNFQSTDGAKLVTYSIKNTGTEPLTGPVTLSDSNPNNKPAGQISETLNVNAI